MSYLGIAGEPNRSKLAAVGIAGPNTMPLIESVKSTVGIAGNLSPAIRNGLAAMSGDNQQQSLGDRIQRDGWGATVWFADYSYIVSPHERVGGGYRVSPTMHWREGRAAVFSRETRTLALYLDSTGYRRCISGTAPKWADDFMRYVQAIDLIDPDGFVSWDDPRDRVVSLHYQRQLEAIYPHDDRMWPVFSIRWTWDDQPPYRLHDLPRWASTRLSSLIPFVRGQQRVDPAELERLARLAVANAVITARDPDFQSMVATHQKVALGGMVKGPMARLVRHLYVKALSALHPARYWLLGQANRTIVNGLAYTDQLDTVSCDGSWWVQEANSHVVAFLDNGLINTVRMGGDGRETFFTGDERRVSLLRSLMGMYAGLVVWPTAPALPIDFHDLAQLQELKQEYQAAQLELGLE